MGSGQDTDYLEDEHIKAKMSSRRITIHEDGSQSKPQKWNKDKYVVEESGGMKDDSDKPRYDLLPPGPMRQLVEILTFGAKKYDDNNWQLVDQKRYIAAMMRHIERWREGESHDEDSGMHHLAHAMCNIMFMLWQETDTPKDKTFIKGTGCYGHMDDMSTDKGKISWPNLTEL